MPLPYSGMGQGGRLQRRRHAALVRKGLHHRVDEHGSRTLTQHHICRTSRLGVASRRIDHMLRKNPGAGRVNTAGIQALEVDIRDNQVVRLTHDQRHFGNRASNLGLD